VTAGSGASPSIPLTPVELSRFTRNTKAEAIAKPLLKNMGMPDVAYMELKALGAGFTCGRCYTRKRMTWEDIVTSFSPTLTVCLCIGQVEHYGETNEQWEKDIKYHRPQQTRHIITFINAHSLDSDSISKPLVKILAKGKTDPSLASGHQVECKLCLAAWRSRTYDCLTGIAEHLQNVWVAFLLCVIGV
jgi:hypothetical protein